MIVDGFDLEAPLVCEGIIGDGCGGGRIFFVEEETLYVYDPLTHEKIMLLDALHSVEKVSKSGCIVSIECEQEVVKFDLSALKKV